ncbi:MAG: hypothetical protein H6702_18415 [Myxococcales bacterium]|nr:hypothetical protein [Myxococcales bacterium]
MSPARAQSWRPEAGAWLIVLALLALAWPTPFHGDQALFVEMARRWHHAGALPYRDLWDLKPPAVHLFYRLGGALFGFHAQGIHTLETLYFLGYGVALHRALRRWLTQPAARAVGLVAAVGLPVAVAGPWGQTQVELLAQPPLFAALWLGLRGGRRGRLLAGLAGGVAVAFKTPFLGLVGLFWLWAAWHRPHRGLRFWAPLLVGFAAPLLALAAWAWAHGFLGALAWTLFVFPAEAALAWPGDPEQLVAGALWAATRLVGLALLAVAGLWLARRDPMARGLGLWAWGAGALIGLQTLSWWPYHYLLLVGPLALLAAAAVDRLAAVRPGWAPLAAAALIALPAARELAPAGRAWLAHPPWRDLTAHQAARYDGLSTIPAELRVGLPDGCPPGGLYVLGNPLYHHLSGCPQALRLNGWSFDILLPDQWGALRAELRRRAPQAVFVEAGQWDLIRERDPATEALLRRGWAVRRESPVGTWFSRPAAPSSGSAPPGR